MEDTEERVEGTSFREIVRIILKKKWIVLAASVFTAVLAALLLGLWINPRFRSYSMDFAIVYPTGHTSIYPDGSPFFYQDIASADFLKEAKDSDEEFKDINIDRMVEEDDVTIVADYEEENGVRTYTGKYTLSIKGRYFDGEKQAESFLTALAAVAVHEMRVVASEVTFITEDDTFGQAPFEEQLAMLSSDKNSIIRRYDTWIENYTGEYVVEVRRPGGETEKKNLSDFRALVSTLYGSTIQSQLEEDLENGGYFQGTEEEFDNYAARLRNEYLNNEAEMSPLKEILDKGTINDAALASRYIQLNARNLHIGTWFGETFLNGTAKYSEIPDAEKGTLTEESNELFAQRIASVRSGLKQASDTLTAVTRGIYEQCMYSPFDEHITVSGGVGVALGVIASFIVAFLVASFAVYAADKTHRKPAPDGTDAASETEGAAAEGEVFEETAAQPQAAEPEAVSPSSGSEPPTAE